MLAFPTQSQWQTAAIAHLRSATYNDSDPKSRRTANLILPRLYISDFFTARNETEMTKLGITHMISVMEHTPTGTMPNMVRHFVPIADRWNANILKYLDGTTEFIRAALAENEDNKVLVHCFQGISRSATVVCAYVIAQAANGMTAAEAIDLVREKRNIICPNDGFRTQLAAYSRRFVGKRGNPTAEKAHPATGRSSKISEGIAERIRRFKAGGGTSSQNALQQVEIEEGS